MIVVHANATDGLTVTQNGQPLRLAVVDEQCRVLVAGDTVARAVESAADDVDTTRRTRSCES